MTTPQEPLEARIARGMDTMLAHFEVMGRQLNQALQQMASAAPKADDAADEPRRIVAFHPPSGSVLHGIHSYNKPSGHLIVIPDGVGECIALHPDVWAIHDEDQHF